eukprot:UN30309
MALIEKLKKEDAENKDKNNEENNVKQWGWDEELAKQLQMENEQGKSIEEWIPVDNKEKEEENIISVPAMEKKKTDSHIATTIFERRVFNVYNFEDKKGSLYYAVGKHLGQTIFQIIGLISKSKKKMGLFDKEDFIKLGLEPKVKNEEEDLSVLISVGYTIKLFVGGLFVRTCKPIMKNNVDPIYLNRLTGDQPEYQLFLHDPTVLTSADEQIAKLMVDEVNQSGGTVPNQKQLKRYFEPWQMKLVSKLCQEYHESNVAFLKEQERIQNEAGAYCFSCNQKHKFEDVIWQRNCEDVICKKCFSNWVETSWENYKAESEDDPEEVRTYPTICCLKCHKEVHIEDIKVANRKIGESVEELKRKSHCYWTGAQKCFHEDCKELFYPKENKLKCSFGHVNCLKCKKCHEGNVKMIGRNIVQKG